jgi:hypothetical protein
MAGTSSAPLADRRPLRESAGVIALHAREDARALAAAEGEEADRAGGLDRLIGPDPRQWGADRIAGEHRFQPLGRFHAADLREGGGDLRRARN